jgi:hypothetical protein
VSEFVSSVCLHELLQFLRALTGVFPTGLSLWLWSRTFKNWLRSRRKKYSKNISEETKKNQHQLQCLIISSTFPSLTWPRFQKDCREKKRLRRFPHLVKNGASSRYHLINSFFLGLTNYFRRTKTKHIIMGFVGCESRYPKLINICCSESWEGVFPASFGGKTEACSEEL